MALQVTIAEIQVLQKDAHLVSAYIKALPGNHKEEEEAVERIQGFVDALMGMDVHIKI